MLKGFINIESNKGRGIGVMVVMVAMNIQSLLQVKIRTGKAMQNLDAICPTCGKKHGRWPCYRETKAYFSYGK